MRQPFIFLSTCHKNKCSHSEGLGDHSVLGWLCQFQSNPGCVDDGDDSKEPVLILSYGSIPWGVLSNYSLGCMQGSSQWHPGRRRTPSVRSHYQLTQGGHPDNSFVPVSLSERDETGSRGGSLATM